MSVHEFERLDNLAIMVIPGSVSFWLILYTIARGLALGCQNIDHKVVIDEGRVVEKGSRESRWSLLFSVEASP